MSPEHGLADGDVVGEGDGVDGVAEVELRRLHGRGVLAPLEGAACTHQTHGLQCGKYF